MPTIESRNQAPARKVRRVFASFFRRQHHESIEDSTTTSPRTPQTTSIHSLGVGVVRRDIGDSDIACENDNALREEMFMPIEDSSSESSDDDEDNDED